MAKLTKEERQRNQRRRNRQLLGVAMTVLVIIGCVAIVRSGAILVANIFDDTAEKEEYAAKVAGLVLFDPLPFEGAENIQDLTLRESAIWGTIYKIMATDVGFEHYDRDPETDQIMLPSLEVDAYLAGIFGSEFQLTHKTFEMEGMNIVFDETLHCYYIPVTSIVGEYTPVVESLSKSDGRLYATVGYIPVDTNGAILTGAATQQVSKYMDYVFERTSGAWYLVAVQESELVAPSSEQPATSSSSVPALEDFETVVLEDIAASQENSDVQGDDADATSDSTQSTDAVDSSSNSADEADASSDSEEDASSSSDSE